MNLNPLEKQEILEKYSKNNMAKLKRISYSLFRRFGGISEKDFDNFYSIANEVLWKATENFDTSKNVPFEQYLNLKLINKFRSEVKKISFTQKRIPPKEIEYLDSPIEEGVSLGEKIPSDFNIEKELSNEIGILQDGKIEKYLNSLSKIQRQIIKMKMNDIPATEIKKFLKISDKEYGSHCKEIKSFDKTQILFKKENFIDLEEDEQMPTIISQTLERSKPKSYSISSIIKKIDNYTIRFDHPAQRESEQWNPKMKGNLISDILQDYPIPALVFAEQIIDGIAVIWDLDGKQRCTNVYNFLKDGFKISKNIRRWMIKYQTKLKDKNGNIILGENGLPQFENKEFDIRGKKYSELPEELQEKINDYTFEVTQYLNCSSEDIIYHISRYNEGRPMTPSQKGMACLGEKYATIVRSISNMDFFKDQGDYRPSEFRNGTIHRVIVESIMASKFLNEWKKQQEEMCSYIRENASINDFDSFEGIVERLSKVVTEDVAEMFNSKDSFLWFSLFDKFTKEELDDEKFIEFMQEFKENLHNKEINGITYDSFNPKNTKDKNIVIKKLSLLQELMNKFLHITKEENVEEFIIKKEEVIKYIKEFNNSDIVKFSNIESKANQIRIAIQSLMMICDKSNLSDKDIQEYILHEDINEEDIEKALLCINSLSDWTLNVDNNSPIFESKNIPTLVSIVKFAYDKEINDNICIEWLENFIEDFKNKVFSANSIQNLNQMKIDLGKFYIYKNRKV